MSTIAAPQLRNREVNRIITEDAMLDADDITIWIDPLDATQGQFKRKSGIPFLN